ncbi:MAG: hypothetical protein WDN46_24840 [Methylocella sp.]
MSARAALNDAADCGVLVRLNGDNLALKAAAKPSRDLLAKLRKHKPEIIALLQHEPALHFGRAIPATTVPAIYRDAWNQLRRQRSGPFSDPESRRAFDAAGRFLAEWTSLALRFQWAPDDLFDLPRGDKTCGLIWFLNGEDVRALGPEHGVTISGRIFDKTTRAEWVYLRSEGGDR